MNPEDFNYQLTNDHKEKDQSFEARAEARIGEWDLHGSWEATGYGRNGEEARINLISALIKLRDQIQEAIETI